MLLFVLAKKLKRRLGVGTEIYPGTFDWVIPKDFIKLPIISRANQPALARRERRIVGQGGFEHLPQIGTKLQVRFQIAKQARPPGGNLRLDARE